MPGGGRGEVKEPGVDSRGFFKTLSLSQSFNSHTLVSLHLHERYGPSRRDLPSYQKIKPYDLYYRS